jgi:hypothetical protein
MTSNLMIQSAKALFAIGAAASMVACASFQPDPPEQAVMKRAQAYWDARLEGDAEKTRSYMNEAFRLAVDDKRFARNYMATFAVAAKVQKATCEPEKCEVGVNLSVNPPIPGRKMGTIDMYSKQTWLLEDGRWNLYQAP